LCYHSPHKFRHGHIHYGSAYAKTIEDFKAVSMNAMHSSMKITDEFHSNLNDSEVQNRISGLNKENQPSEDSELELFREFINWKKNLVVQRDFMVQRDFDSYNETLRFTLIGEC
jgi:hypothetical protein